jgi:hypothetical protein
MGDHEKQADDLSPSLVLWDVISTKIYPLVLYTGFGTSLSLFITLS